VLWSPLPISVSAAKQKFQANLNRRWLKLWADFPFNKFRKKLFKLSRNQSSLMMQLRTGHIPLNVHLRRIGKVESDRCQKCNDIPGVLQAKETIGHFLFDCQAHDAALNQAFRPAIVPQTRRHDIQTKMQTTSNVNLVQIGCVYKQPGRSPSGHYGE
jgi:hypothetical protein